MSKLSVLRYMRLVGKEQRAQEAVSSGIPVLLKLTGEVFVDRVTGALSTAFVQNLIGQIKRLYPEYLFGIVVGGGNFFRGGRQSGSIGITPAAGHQVGMLATRMNGIFLKDLLEQQGVPAEHLCALSVAGVGASVSQQAIQDALSAQKMIVFSGGTGNPFFTTDTSAVLRALQMRAREVWKGTHVDGVYTKDPRTHADAQLLKRVTFSRAMADRMGVMDLAAYALAQEYAQPVRVFDIFTPDALLRTAYEVDFGSLIY